jgi:hypothetical protein
MRRYRISGTFDPEHREGKTSPTSLAEGPNQIDDPNEEKERSDRSEQRIPETPERKTNLISLSEDPNQMPIQMNNKNK